MIFRLLIAIFSALMLSACYASHGGEGEAYAPTEVSIAHLKSLCKGSHYRVVNDYMVRGVVVATDWLGELNNSAIIVDESGGLEIALDCRHIGDNLPIYSEITLLCNGLMLARIGGKIEIGAPPTAEFPLDNIDDEVFGRYIRVVGICEDFEPATKRFSEIGIEDIGNIVRIDNVRVCEEEQGLLWCDLEEDKPITTYRIFLDKEGNNFAIRTLGTCHYAKEKMQTKEISVVGIIDYSDNRYFLRIVNKWFI